MFLRLPESPWNLAQQPGLGIYHRFTVSNSVLGGTAPEAAAIATAIYFGRCDTYHSGGGLKGRRRQPLKLFPCHYDGCVSLRLPLRSIFGRCDTYRSGGAYFSMFSFAEVKLWLNCQPGVLSWDLGHYFFGCCLVNSCGGLFR